MMKIMITIATTAVTTTIIITTIRTGAASISPLPFHHCNDTDATSKGHIILLQAISENYSKKNYRYYYNIAVIILL